MSNLLVYGPFIVAIAAMTANAEEALPFKITTKRVDDGVEVKAEKDKATFSVHSPFGISHAVIERAEAVSYTHLTLPTNREV